MPQRFLRPGLTNSERFNACSMQAQSLWLRILTRVDDFGRYDGRPSVLVGDLFSVWNELHPDDAVTPQRIPELSCELMQNQLADFYEVDGKKVVQLLQWQERPRNNTKSRWPDKQDPQESAGIGRNPQDPAGIRREILLPSSKYHRPCTLVQVPSPVLNPPPGGECDLLGVKVVSKPDTTCPAHKEQLLVTPDDIYAAYPRHIAKKDALRAITKSCAAKCPGCLLDLTRKFAQAKAGSDLTYVPYPATWFNRESYLDDPAEWIRKPQPPHPVVDRKVGMFTGERPHD